MAPDPKSLLDQRICQAKSLEVKQGRVSLRQTGPFLPLSHCLSTTIIPLVRSGLSTTHTYSRFSLSPFLLGLA